MTATVDAKRKDPAGRNGNNGGGVFGRTGLFHFPVCILMMSPVIDSDKPPSTKFS